MKALKSFWIATTAMCLVAFFSACSDGEDNEPKTFVEENNYYEADEKEATVTLETSGTLRLMLGEDVLTVTSLKVSGPINGDDIICLRQMLRGKEVDSNIWGVLTVLDISKATIVEGGNSYYNSFNTSNCEIGDYMFYGCEILKIITLPENVTSIGNHSFEGCAWMTQVTIPESVTSLGNYAFNCCYDLTNVTIGNNVTTIGSYAFYHCYNLIDATFGNSVTAIGGYAFYGCSALNGIAIPEGLTAIGDYAFSNCSALTEITIPDGITAISNHTFENCSSLMRVTLGENVSTIGDYAFSGCSGLMGISMPNSVTDIGRDAFRGCTGLAEITIGYGVTKISTGAFKGCTGLTAFDVVGDNEYYCSVEGVLYSKDMKRLVQFPLASHLLPSFSLPDGVGQIGDYSFEDCTGLTEVTIPISTTEIGSYAFNGCTELTQIYSKNPTPPSTTSSTFSGVDGAICILNVPTGSKEAYSQANYWSKFYNIKEVDF